LVSSNIYLVATFYTFSYRFAYESMKLFLCNLVKEFRVELREDTKLNYKKGSTLLVAFTPLYLDLVLRNGEE